MTLPARSARRRAALTVGVSEGVEGYSPLPGVPAEIEQVKACWARYPLRPTTLMDAEAAKSEVISHISEAALLHVACHGVFESGQADRSGLVLIGASGKADILSLRELSELDLAGLEHMTLSSCWSADVFSLPGRSIISLPETLWRSGAGSILGSLWPVDDAQAVSFTRVFYEYLHELPRDKALQRTQLDCLQGRLPGVESATAPIWWAGFSLFGDHSKLHM
jgi:CHAT domain-containing protein